MFNEMERAYLAEEEVLSETELVIRAHLKFFQELKEKDLEPRDLVKCHLHNVIYI